MEPAYDPMDHEITVAKYDLMKRYDDIPVGPHYHMEGAPRYDEFPGPDFKPKKLTFKRQMSKNMSTFKGRIKHWWTGLISKRRLIKPAMKSTTGAKFRKPIFKTLKHKTKFNKTKKYDPFRNSMVLITPMQHSHFAQNIPAVTISRVQLIKNFDEIPVGPNVHFEGAPRFTAFPTGELKRKALPVSKQFKRDFHVFTLRVKKWWSGLKARKSFTETSLKMKKQLRASLISKKRTHFDKSHRYNHWNRSMVLEKPIREKIYVKDLPPAITISKMQLKKNFDEIPVGAHVHFEGAPHFTAYPAMDMQTSAPFKKQFSHDMSRFMTRTKKWWKGLQARKVIKKTSFTLKRQMLGTFSTKRTKFDKTKRFDHWSRAMVLHKSITAGHISYMTVMPKTKMMISRKHDIMNWDEVPVGQHFEGAPVFSEFPTTSFKPKSRPLTKTIKKNVDTFLSRSMKYYRGLKGRRIMKKGQLAMKKGMKKIGFKMTKRTKFDKTKKFDHWNKALVLDKPITKGMKPKPDVMFTKKPVFEESKQEAFHSRKMEHKL